MTLSADAVDIIHISEAPRLRVSATAEAEPTGHCVLTLSGTMCSTTVPAATEPIGRWLRRARPERLGVDLGGVDFIDGRGVSLLVELQQQARALGIDWSITDAGDRARDVLEVCELLGSMGVEAVAH
jgi:anti-anti-sigma factor